MSTVNMVMLIGRLGKDPELRYSQSGTPILSMSIATDKSYTDQQGARHEHTEWHKIVCFQRVAENCAQYLSKGSLVFVEGSLTTRQWKAEDGTDRYSTEVHARTVKFLDGRSGCQVNHALSASDRGKSKAPDTRRNSRPVTSAPNESAMDDAPF